MGFWPLNQLMGQKMAEEGLTYMPLVYSKACIGQLSQNAPIKTRKLIPLTSLYIYIYNYCAYFFMGFMFFLSTSIIQQWSSILPALGAKMLGISVMTCSWSDIWKNPNIYLYTKVYIYMCVYIYICNLCNLWISIYSYLYICITETPRS